VGLKKVSLFDLDPVRVAAAVAHRQFLEAEQRQQVEEGVLPLRIQIAEHRRRPRRRRQQGEHRPRPVERVHPPVLQRDQDRLLGVAALGEERHLRGVALLLRPRRHTRDEAEPPGPVRIAQPVDPRLVDLGGGELRVVIALLPIVRRRMSGGREGQAQGEDQDGEQRDAHGGLQISGRPAGRTGT